MTGEDKYLYRNDRPGYNLKYQKSLVPKTKIIDPYCIIDIRTIVTAENLNKKRRLKEKHRMERIKINKEQEKLLLEGFTDLDDQVTIKKFGSKPERIVIVPGSKATNSQQVVTYVKDGMITDPAAVKLFLDHMSKPELSFINLDDGYYEYIPPEPRS